MAKKNKNQTKKEFKKYIDLLYMTPKQIGAKELSELLKENKEFSVQLWEEFNVLELEFNNENSVDIEIISTTQFKDPSDASFVKNRNIQTIFALKLCEEDLDVLVKYFEEVIAKFDGFLCADSDDFSPVYVGSSKK